MSDLSPDAKDLWAKAKKNALDPSDAQVERVRQAVLDRIAAAPTAPGPASTSLPKWVKIAGLCGALGGMVTGGTLWLSRTRPPVVSASDVVTTAPQVAQPVPSAATAEAVLP